MRSVRTYAILPLDFGADFLEISQCVRDGCINLGQDDPIEFLKDIFRIASVEEPAVNGTYRNPLSGEPRTASAGPWSLYDELADFHGRILP